jgi:hypothetical protein
MERWVVTTVSEQGSLYARDTTHVGEQNAGLQMMKFAAMEQAIHETWISLTTD